MNNLLSQQWCLCLNVQNRIKLCRAKNHKFGDDTTVYNVSAGWCSGFTLASCAEGSGFYPRLMQVVQSPSCELVQLRLEIHTP